MLKTFEDITKPLTEDEIKLIPHIVRIMRNHVGKKSAITNKRMREYLASDLNIPAIHDSRFRAIIHHITVNDILPLLTASANGYFIAEVEEEANNYLESLEGRVHSIEHKKIAYTRQVKKYFKNKIKNQISLL